MPYVVTAKIGGRRIESDKYPTKAKAEAYAKKTKEHRPGSNPRVKKVK